VSGAERRRSAAAPRAKEVSQVQSNRARLAGVVVIVAAIVLFIVLQSSGGGSSSGPSTQPPLMTIQVDKNAKPVDGILDSEYTAGQHIKIKVTSAIAGEVHFHGYNIMKTVKKPGGSVTFDVPAKLEGVFEMEMEAQHSQIAQITVDPG
jgi:hypothetical protein